MGQWWYDNIVEPGKQPLLCCLLAFVVTFLITRAITRMIRAGVGPFRNNVSASGVHVHHAVPGIILLIIGALVALRSDDFPWQEVAGVMIGIGMSLILDEFALILHLQDVYWAKEGRVSVELVGLTAATLGLLMIGFSPFGVDDLTIGDFSIRLGLISGVALHGLLILVCVLKGKYRAALISCLLPLIAWVLAIRLARPTSWWARKFYGPQRATPGSRAGGEVRSAVGSAVGLAERSHRGRPDLAGSATGASGAGATAASRARRSATTGISHAALILSRLIHSASHRTRAQVRIASSARSTVRWKSRACPLPGGGPPALAATACRTTAASSASPSVTSSSARRVELARPVPGADPLPPSARVQHRVIGPRRWLHRT